MFYYKQVQPSLVWLICFNAVASAWSITEIIYFFFIDILVVKDHSFDEEVKDSLEGEDKEEVFRNTKFSD